MSEDRGSRTPPRAATPSAASRAAYGLDEDVQGMEPAKAYAADEQSQLQAEAEEAGKEGEWQVYSQEEW
eukprot:7408019-Alexandrium_andersonii.AAC.1